MTFPQKFIRFAFCILLLLGMLFSTSLSKAQPFGDSFNLVIHVIVLINFFIHIRLFWKLKMSMLIFFFTFLSSVVNGFVGLKGGMFLNFLTFSAIEIALIADTYSYHKAYFKINYISLGLILYASIFCVLIGINSQPFTGMYMSQKVGGIPVQIWGLFSDKNIFGFSMMLFFLMTLLLPDSKYRSTFLVISFIFIILSGNRSGLLTVCITLVFYLMLKPEYSVGQKVAGSIKALIVLTVLLWLYLHSPLNTRGTESNDREELYSIAYFYIRDNFWFGIGRALIVDGTMVHTHNLYIQVLAEEGFFCLLIYILLFIKVLVRGSFSTKVLCLSVFIFTGFNPILVPGQLFSITALVIVGRYLDRRRAEENNLITTFADEKQGELSIIT
jgi:hypothetical protein